ncbi:MAG: hypothetical protein Q4Q53_07140 [Methanocorpusculum sp.]|nr:hypothetical protein [Methanocorpusculum sp.]
MESNQKLFENIARVLLLLTIVSAIAGLLIHAPWLYAVAGVSLILSFVTFYASRKYREDKK